MDRRQFFTLGIGAFAAGLNLILGQKPSRVFIDEFPPLNFQPVSGDLINQITMWDQWRRAGAVASAYYDSAFATLIGGYPAGAVVASKIIPGGFWRSVVDDNLTDPDVVESQWVQIPFLDIDTSDAA